MTGELTECLSRRAGDTDASSRGRACARQALEGAGVVLNLANMNISTVAAEGSRRPQQRMTQALAGTVLRGVSTCSSSIMSKVALVLRLPAASGDWRRCCCCCAVCRYIVRSLPAVLQGRGHRADSTEGDSAVLEEVSPHPALKKTDGAMHC